MAGDGGDTGGSSKGSGDTGGGGNDGSGGSFGGYSASDPAYTSSTAGFGSGAGMSGVEVSGGTPAGGADPFASGAGGNVDPFAGAGGGISDPLGGGGGNDPLGGLISGGGGSGDGLNLGSSGPVGGISQPMGMGSNDLGTGTNSTVSQPSDPLGTTVPGTGAGAGAAAFAAPEGVSGSPQLSDWISNPTGSTPSSPDQGIFDQLDAAQHGAANQYADTASTGVPAAPGGSTLSAVTPASSGSGGSGGGSSTGGGSNGILGTGITTNGLGIAAAGAGLLNNLINGPKNVPAAGQLNTVANNATATSNDLLAKGNQQGDQFGKPALQAGQDQVAKGQVLQDYVATGKLPQGYEDQITQGVQSAKATIISNYAQRGLSTDPTMNSSLAQELSQVDARVPAMREQLAAQLASTGNSIVGSGNATSQTGNQLTGNQLLTDGLSAAGISSGIYTTLANLQNDKQKQQGAAIANFAAALNGGNKGVTLNVGK